MCPASNNADFCISAGDQLRLCTYHTLPCCISSLPTQRDMADTNAKRARRAPSELAIGVDLGGTHVLAALVDPYGNVHARKRLSLAADDRGSHSAISSAVSECIVDMWRHAHSHFAECLPLRGVGIAVPGNVDPKRGLARYLPNFGWRAPVDLASLVLDRPATGAKGAPTTVRELLSVDRLHMRNDGRCAALAERHFGVGSTGEHSVMAMLTLGTGIGGALIHDPTPANQGALFDGCTFDAGDFGHHVMRSGAEAFQCVCGNRGCFECHASAAGLVRHWRVASGDEGGISLDDARAVVQRMRDGDSTAKAAFAAYRADLATGLANLVTFYNPSLLVLGGGLSATPELYEGLEKAVDGSTLPATRGMCKIVRSALGPDGAAMGAAWLAFAEAIAIADARPRGADVSAGDRVVSGVHSPGLGRSRSPGLGNDRERAAVAAATTPAGTPGPVVCLGLVCTDSTMWVEAEPTPDTKCVARQSLTCGGGNAANSAVAASRLQPRSAPPVRLLTKVGSDAHGEALLRELEHDRVDTRWAVRGTAGQSTPSSVIVVCGPRRTIIHDPGLMLSAPLVPSELASPAGSAAADSDAPGTPTWLAGASLLHLDGRHPAAAVHAARCARAASIAVMIDVERPRPGLRELLSLADFVVSASDFPSKLAAELATADGKPASPATLTAAEPATLVTYLLRCCPAARWVCVTLGAEGAVALERRPGASLVHVPAHKLPAQGPGAVRDSTGAGDAFIGAIAAGVRCGVPLADTLRLAAFVAAANCAAEGARGGMPHHADLPPDLRALLADAELAGTRE